MKKVILIYICLSLLISSCGLFKKPPVPQAPNVVIPAKSIQGDAKATTSLAKSIKNKAPEAEVEAESIIQHQKNIIEKAETIIDLQPQIDELKKQLADETKARKAAEAETIKAKKEAEEKRISGLIKLLYVFTIGGIIAAAVGLVMIFHPAAPSKMGGLISGVGGLVAGLCIAAIKYIVIIQIVFGIVIILAVLFGLYLAWEYSKKHKVTDELMKSFHVTDKGEINEIQSQATQKLVALHKVKQRKNGVQ